MSSALDCRNSPSRDSKRTIFERTVWVSLVISTDPRCDCNRLSRPSASSSAARTPGICCSTKLSVNLASRDWRSTSFATYKFTTTLRISAILFGSCPSRDIAKVLESSPPSATTRRRCNLCMASSLGIFLTLKTVPGFATSAVIKILLRSLVGRKSKTSSPTVPAAKNPFSSSYSLNDPCRPTTSSKLFDRNFSGISIAWICQLSPPQANLCDPIKGLATTSRSPLTLASGFPINGK